MEWDSVPRTLMGIIRDANGMHGMHGVSEDLPGWSRVVISIYGALVDWKDRLVSKWLTCSGMARHLVLSHDPRIVLDIDYL